MYNYMGKILTGAHREFTYQLRTYGNRCFPHMIRQPYPKARLSEVLLMDPELNEESSPPDDESIDLRSIWVVEFYTPAHMDDLFDSLEQMGLKSEDDLRNPLSTLKNLGAIQYGTAWIRLGKISSRVEPEADIWGNLTAQLPGYVRFAYADIYCFTPSLVALIFKFVFTEEYGRVFQQALHQYRHSYVTSINVGYRIHEPGQQKSEHIYQIRKDTSSVVSEWISKNIPGVFSTGLLKGEFPTCEFVTLRKAKPFPSPNECGESQAFYLRHLGLGNSFRAWESANVPGLKLECDEITGKIKHYAILSINELDWIGESSDSEPGESIEAKVFRLHERMKGVLSVWAISSLLQGYADHFRELRRSALIGTPQVGRTEDALQEISESLYYSVDISAVISEIASSLERRFPIGYDIETFYPCSDWQRASGQNSLWFRIQNEIEEFSKWLQATDNSLPAQLTQYGSSLGLLENIRLQQRIKHLTYALTFLTLALAALTIVSVLDVQWSDIAEWMMRTVRILNH